MCAGPESLPTNRRGARQQRFDLPEGSPGNGPEGAERRQIVARAADEDRLQPDSRRRAATARKPSARQVFSGAAATGWMTA